MATGSDGECWPECPFMTVMLRFNWLLLSLLIDLVIQDEYGRLSGSSYSPEMLRIDHYLDARADREYQLPCH